MGVPAVLRAVPHVVFATAALTISVGCAPAQPEPTPEPAPAASETRARGRLPVTDTDVCTVHCERAETCGIHRDACERDCPGRGRPIEKMRPDFVFNLMLCLEGASCNSLKDGVAWSSCHDSITKTLPVTKVLRKFCFESSRRAAECKRADDADQMACLTRFRFAGDPTLDEARRCMTGSCADVPGCMASVLTK